MDRQTLPASSSTEIEKFWWPVKMSNIEEFFKGENY